MLSKKILIIGAGIGQVNLVRLAHEMGHYVIVVSPQGPYPAIDLADELFECDIYDRDRIVDFAKETGIDAVTSDQNDLMMPTVAYVSEKLGLPGNTFEQVMSYCDKNRFREICALLGLPVPIHAAVKSIDAPLLDVPLPWIVKPADSQSNIGITKVNSLEEYPRAVQLALSKSKQGTAIVEQFFEGIEYVCEGFVFDGKYYCLSFGDRKYFDGILIPCQTLFPSELGDTVKQRIIACEERFTEYVRPNFGIIHSEYLYNEKSGEICLVESAIRGGGVYISSHLIPMAIGVDANKLLLGCALDEIDVPELEYNLSNRTERASAYVCFTLPQGVIWSIEGVEKVRQMDYVKMCSLSNLKVGMQTEPMTAKGMRQGPILIEAENRMELQERIAVIQRTITIDVEGLDGIMKSIIWN